ncbi:MAG: hypothetical protein GY849_20580 [Deltaproteobacteria bacterium]|nr:hypothetical protein [Deltaproteobacteria bacterium]
MNSNSTDTKEIRRFGLIALIFFGSLCALGFWLKKPLPISIFGALSLLGAGFILFPSLMRPVHGGWVKIAHVIGRMVTILILTLAYYLVITPAALIKPFFGGRPLPIKPDKKALSYWVERTEPAQPSERFLKRY